MNSNAAQVTIQDRNRPRRELRHAFRARLDLPVDVLLNGLSHRCRATDISLGGMSIELTPPLAHLAPHFVGTYRVQMSPTQILTVNARTVWRCGAMQGVCFVGLGKEERLAIGEAVERTLRPLVSDVDRLEVAELKDRLAPWRNRSQRRTAAIATPRAPLKVEGLVLLRALIPVGGSGARQPRRNGTSR